MDCDFRLRTDAKNAMLRRFCGRGDAFELPSKRNETRSSTENEETNHFIPADRVVPRLQVQPEFALDWRGTLSLARPSVMRWQR
jgi:hypothetical protein